MFIYHEVIYMEQEKRSYIAIDLKSFYASAECVKMGLDPLTTNLVVADSSRTEKTICLAVSPSLKAYGIPGRARLFEVVQRVREVNEQRRKNAPNYRFTGKSHYAPELKENSSLELDYIVAMPQMAHYMKVSNQIYDIYLKYIAPEDIHVYSIDEVFIDATAYLKTYMLTPRELAAKLIHEVHDTTGITATAGIGTNLYLCKIAMDIVAKKIPADKDGVRIAELDEMSYRRQLWSHRPLTDFWRVGRGYAKKLEENYIYTMGDIARCSIGGKYEHYNEELLYKLFGVNAELLIDHAWGWEPCTLAEIKKYKPATNSISTGQVLKCPYDFEKGRLIVREMTDLLTLDLVDRGFVTDQMVLTVDYDIVNMSDGKYKGPTARDHYGRRVPKSAHGSINLDRQTSSSRIIIEAVSGLYDRIVDNRLMVRRMYVVANHVIPESKAENKETLQLDLFTDYESQRRKNEAEENELLREREIQRALLKIKKKYGKNAVLKGMNYSSGATTIERNEQVGGHKA